MEKGDAGGGTDGLGLRGQMGEKGKRGEKGGQESGRVASVRQAGDTQLSGVATNKRPLVQEGSSTTGGPPMEPVGDTKGQTVRGDNMEGSKASVGVKHKIKWRRSSRNSGKREAGQGEKQQTAPEIAVTKQQTQDQQAEKGATGEMGEGEPGEGPVEQQEGLRG